MELVKSGEDDMFLFFNQTNIGDTFINLDCNQKYLGVIRKNLLEKDTEIMVLKAITCVFVYC
jgi:hypothetical protein